MRKTVPFCDNPQCPLHKITVPPKQMVIEQRDIKGMLKDVLVLPDMTRNNERMPTRIMRHKIFLTRYRDQNDFHTHLCDTCVGVVGLVERRFYFNTEKTIEYMKEVAFGIYSRDVLFNIARGEIAEVMLKLVDMVGTTCPCLDQAKETLLGCVESGEAALTYQRKIETLMAEKYESTDISEWYL